MGCFGAPLTEANKQRYINHHEYNQASIRKSMINNASPDTFGFDCVNVIKGVLWGWNGDESKTYGGAKYAINGVPDVSADGMIAKCSNISTDFSSVEVGEAVWCPGHIGVYIGDGLAVECTPLWNNCVQITACNCEKQGYNSRYWTKHGKLPYVIYEIEEKNMSKFTDVPESHWAYKAIESLAEIGVVNGYKDGTFKPDSFTTRAEFIATIVRGDKEYSESVDYTTSLEFSDVSKNAWYANYLGFALNKGLIRGYEDNTFKPDNFITRAESATIISKVIG